MIVAESINSSDLIEKNMTSAQIFTLGVNYMGVNLCETMATFTKIAINTMLNFTRLTLQRGRQMLLENVNLIIHQGQRVGITGANGAGKSSLFALMRGELHPEAGDYTAPNGLVIAHVAQETPALDMTAIDYVLQGDQELCSVQAQLAEAEQHDDHHRQANLHARLEAIGGYTARSRAAKLLDGLGFKPAEIDRPVQSFSGGWRMRLNLAQALMCRSDLLLLDEPTNHLDLEAVLWLQDWLRAYPGTLLLISHDRDFLDDVTTHIAHLEQRTITLYSGNYSAFEVQRAARLAQQAAAYEQQQREVAHMQSFVDRFKAQATKARQAQSRIKALERMELIAPAHVDSPFHFSFLAPEKLPNPLLTLDKASAGYHHNPIVSGVKLSLHPGDRIGLLGPNGAGKSTLIKVLAGAMAPLTGERLGAKDLRVGYFAQHQLEQLDPTESPLKHFSILDPKASEQSLRDFLGGFDFRGDRVTEAVAPFSGGEKARLALALLIYQRPNLLLLDEPTNHLDLEMRTALTIALQEFDGALVVVSHDRHLLRSTCDKFIVVNNGSAEDFDGDLEDYHRWLAERHAAASIDTGEPEEDKAHSATARKQKRQQDAEQRKRLQPLRQRIQKLEAEMDKLSKELATIEQQLADPALYEESARGRLKEVLAKQAAATTKQQSTEEDWLAAQEEMEQAEM